MKVSPVAGTPTIQQPSPTGLSPEKLTRIKGIASGNREIIEPEKKEEEKKEELKNAIAMVTNKTPETVTSLAEEAPQAQETTQSTTPDAIVQAKEATEVTEPISPQLAALARQRRALQVKEQELAEREKALTGNSKSDLEAQLKATPLKVLQELGVTYDQLTQEILGNQSNAEVLALKEEIKALKGDIDNKFTSQATAQDEQAINYVADKIDALLQANPDEFELLTAHDDTEEIVRRIFDHWKKTGKELDAKTVAQEYQNELLEEAARFAKLKMVQSKIVPAEPTAPVTPQPTPGMKTLTNKDSARPSLDRRTRAILAAQGQLKR